MICKWRRPFTFTQKAFLVLINMGRLINDIVLQANGWLPIISRFCVFRPCYGNWCPKSAQHTSDSEKYKNPRYCGSIDWVIWLHGDTARGNLSSTPLHKFWWSRLTNFHKVRIKQTFVVLAKRNRPWQDSNLQSPDPKSGALSIRPHGLIWFRGKCIRWHNAPVQQMLQFSVCFGTQIYAVYLWHPPDFCCHITYWMLLVGN